MCITNNPTEEKKLVYNKSTRKEFGIVTSVDISLKLMKEFLEARQMIEAGPMPILDDEEANKANREMYEKRVKPFFDHMSEIIDAL